MEDCELFNVCSTEIRSVVISISSITCVYLAIKLRSYVGSNLKLRTPRAN